MKNIWTVVITVVVVGGIAFYGGTKYAEGKTPMRTNLGNAASATRGVRGQMGNGMFGMRAMGGGFTAGDILSKDDTSITLKMRTGGTKIVFFGPNTPIMKSIKGYALDLKIGESVTVGGEANQDGSITATNIDIRPLPFATTTPRQ